MKSWASALPDAASPETAGMSHHPAYRTGYSTRPAPRHTVCIDCSKNGLPEIPQGIPADTLSLNMSFNMLTQLPPSFGHTFSALHSLDISGNQIATLPEEIRHLQCLRELNANRNALTELPAAIGCLRNLEVLDISENHMESLHVSLSRLESLRMLSVSDNRLTALPSHLGLLVHNLRVLIVDGNPFNKSCRDLVKPILTVSTKDAKKIAKDKEKSERLREKAAKKDGLQNAGIESSTPLHTNEYSAALKRLVTVRLRRTRSAKQSSLPTPAAASVSVSASAGCDARQSHRPLSLTPGCQASFRDSAFFQSGTLANQPAGIDSSDGAGASAGSGAGTSSGGAAHGSLAGFVPRAAKYDNRISLMSWGPAFHLSTELSEYMTRQLPPLPSPLAIVPLQTPPAAATAESVRNVSMDIALPESEAIVMARSSQSRHSTAISDITTTTTAGLTDRISLRSTSQESHGSSVDDNMGLIQDAAKVARVLWQLCDEWDLDPLHSEHESIGRMLLQLRSSAVRVDTSSGIDRVYREKALSAGGSQRLKILSELLVTEVTYVDTLKNVVGIYLNPMREAKILSESELREIFSNIEVILAFHNDHFLPAITHAISQLDMAIGSVFLHHGPHLKLYSVYTNNHETSVATLVGVASRRAVSNFIQDARGDVTQLGQVGLDGHLLTPVQRLPRYRMLLIDLLSNTPTDHPDHESLYAALKDLNNSIYEINEKKRLFEDQSRLAKIQEKVAGSVDIPLVVPRRVFKLMANFRMQAFSELATDRLGSVSVRRVSPGTVYRFFLFSDIIMQCTIIMNKDLKVNRVYRLGTRVSPAEVTQDNELRIVDSTGILYLKGDLSDIRKWAQEINRRLRG